MHNRLKKKRFCTVTRTPNTWGTVWFNRIRSTEQNKKKQKINEMIWKPRVTTFSLFHFILVALYALWCNVCRGTQNTKGRTLLRCWHTVLLISVQLSDGYRNGMTMVSFAWLSVANSRPWARATGHRITQKRSHPGSGKAEVKTYVSAL